LAAKDIDVSTSIDLLNYRKGFWFLPQPDPVQWVQLVRAVCDNEDLNRNGVSEVFSNAVVEDANGSFNLLNGRPALEPRKADVAVSFEGSPKTNAVGQVVLRIEYPKNVASWVEFNLVVAASGIGGSEGRANFSAVLPVPADVVTKVNSSPPFQLSPYGVEDSPTVAASLPGSSKPPAMLCTNPN
jgi:hypothetical protein